MLVLTHLQDTRAKYKFTKKFATRNVYIFGEIFRAGIVKSTSEIISRVRKKA